MDRHVESKRERHRYRQKKREREGVIYRDRQTRKRYIYI